MKRLLIAAAVAAFAIPSAAQAATVHIGPTRDWNNAVVYQAGAGERNRLDVTYTSGTATTPFTVTVHDPGAVITPGARCVSDNPHQARCVEDAEHYDWIYHTVVRLGDRDDRFKEINPTPYPGPGFFVGGGAGDDVITTGRSDDTVAPGTGDDKIDGGVSADTISYAGRSRPVDVDLVRGTAIASGERDTFRKVDSITGGDGADRLAGDGSWNIIRGGAGGDRLIGRGGNDPIYGGAGRDRLVGGAGSDYLDPGSALDSLSCGSGSRDVVVAPVAGERMSRHCDVADFTDESADRWWALAPNARSVSRRAARFAIGCPSYSQDDGEFRPCGGSIAVRTNAGKLVARGKIPTRTREESSAIVVAKLTKLGRRLTAHRRVTVNVFLGGGMPHVAWTIGLRR
jgi:hypothetical protein